MEIPSAEAIMQDYPLTVDEAARVPRGCETDATAKLLTLAQARHPELASDTTDLWNTACRWRGVRAVAYRGIDQNLITWPDGREEIVSDDVIWRWTVEYCRS